MSKPNISTEEFFRTLYPDLNGHFVEIRKVPEGKQKFCRTIEEAVEMTKDAIEGYMESLRAHGEPLPQDESLVVKVTVGA